MATIQQPIRARGDAVHPGRRLVLAADRPAAKAATSPDETIDEVIDGPRWQYDRYFDTLIARVRRNWSDEGAAHALGAERPGREVSTVALRVVLLPNGRLRHVGVE